MHNILGCKKSLATLCVLLLVAALGLWQRTTVLSWYYLRELASADPDNREYWVNRTISLDWAVVPGLLQQLTTKDPTVANNVAAALGALAQRWGQEDARNHALAEELRQRFAGWSPLGQISGLQVMTAMFDQDGPKTWPDALTRTAAELLHASIDRVELRGAALVLAGVLLDRAPQGPWLDSCRALAEKGLSDTFPRTRLAAIQLLLRAPLQDEQDLLAKVVPMLHDESAAIRRAAVLAMAPARDLVTEDDLLPLLHDRDVEVRKLCDAALRSRGLSDEHIELARLISDENPRARLKLIERLGRSAVLDNPSAWLRRLSQDSCSAVRAAAIRAAAQHPQVDLGDRLCEMAQQDPSETVRQNAQFFLSQLPARVSGGTDP